MMVIYRFSNSVIGSRRVNNETCAVFFRLPVVNPCLHFFLFYCYINPITEMCCINPGGKQRYCMAMVVRKELYYRLTISVFHTSQTLFEPQLVLTI